MDTQQKYGQMINNENCALFGADYTSNKITKVFITAVQEDNAARRQSGLPIAQYDAVCKRAYLEYADEIREYVENGSSE